MADLNHSLTPEELEELATLLTLEVSDQPDGGEWIIRDRPEASQESAWIVVDEALAALPYGLPLRPISPDLKDRLFNRITLETALIESELYPMLSLPLPELIQRSQALSWQPILSTAMEMATLQIDEVNRQVAFFVRATTGGNFPKHWHATGEEVLVLSGDFIVDDTMFGAGDRIFSPPNTAHEPATQEGCLLFCLSSLDDTFMTA